MDIDTVLKESRAAVLGDYFGIRTQAGKERFAHQLRQFSSEPATLFQRQQAICLPKRPSAHLAELFDKAAALEPELSVFFEKSQVEKNSYDQLLFSEWEATKPLNTIPFLLVAVCVMKIYIAPVLAISTPLILLVGPYFILRILSGISMPIPQYIEFMKRFLGISSQEGFFSFKNIAKISIGTFSTFQNAYQTIQNSRHLSSINSQLLEKAAALREIKTLLDELLAALDANKKMENPLANLPDDSRQLFAEIWDLPYRLKATLIVLGELEVVYRLSRCSLLRPVEFLGAGSGGSGGNSTEAYLRIQGGFDPSLSSESRKPFSLRLGQAILTGPNRGGKSTVLRGVLLNVWLAQTLGVCFSQKMVLRPFDWIASGLRLEDLPGKASMFEREVEFASRILRKAGKESGSLGLVLFDELFHSTNPPDGAKTAAIFLETLWKRSNVASMISTHVFDLAERAPASVQRLCVPATREPSGNLHFHYQLTTGICRVSSVEMILKEQGLLRAAAETGGAEKGLRKEE